MLFQSHYVYSRFIDNVGPIGILIDNLVSRSSLRLAAADWQSFLSSATNDKDGDEQCANDRKENDSVAHLVLHQVVVPLSEP